MKKGEKKKQMKMIYSGNDMQDEGAKLLYEGLRINTTLTDLNVSGGWKNEVSELNDDDKKIRE